jgi:hypothetical protein
MKTITISEKEYNNMQKNILELKKKLELLQDSEFIKKLEIAYRYFLQSNKSQKHQDEISIKRGSAKKTITYIANDFTEPISDFKEYM